MLIIDCVGSYNEERDRDFSPERREKKKHKHKHKHHRKHKHHHHHKHKHHDSDYSSESDENPITEGKDLLGGILQNLLLKAGAKMAEKSSQ